jgi:3-hydroxybutyryl-CoA dehydrogenase
VKIGTIAVIGAGKAGRAIAQCSLRAGYRTVLEDFSASTLEQALGSIRQTLDQVPDENAGCAERSASSSLAKLTTCTNVEDAIRDADLIIETAADEMETKLELFTIFDKFAKPNAILATTTRIHSIDDIAEITACPGRCVALSFDPPEKPTHLSVISGKDTLATTIDFCVAVGERLVEFAGKST